MNEIFFLELSKIQPSQLFISKRKLRKVKKKMTQNNGTIDPIPIKKIGEELVYTDGHTRAFAAFKMGINKIPVEWEDENLDWEMYEVCVKWCKDNGIFTIKDLENRIVTHKKYKIVWYERCKIMQKEIEKNRLQINSKY